MKASRRPPARGRSGFLRSGERPLDLECFEVCTKLHKHTHTRTHAWQGWKFEGLLIGASRSFRRDELLASDWCARSRVSNFFLTPALALSTQKRGNRCWQEGSKRFGVEPSVLEARAFSAYINYALNTVAEAPASARSVELRKPRGSNALSGWRRPNLWVYFEFLLV